MKYLNLVNSSAVNTSSTKKATIMPLRKYLMNYRQLKILTGILGETMANKIHGSDEKLKTSELPQCGTISNFILDENVNLDVRRFFKANAWTKFMKIINHERVCVFLVILVFLIQQKTCFREKFI